MNTSSTGLAFGCPVASPGSLWRPEFERDACGIGLVADLHGRKSNRILRKALESVCCLTHRGAVAADAKTGDGAGILTQIPVDLLRSGLGRGQGRLLRRDEDLAVGMIFFPQEAEARHRAYRICEAAVEESELIFLEWRLVPTDTEALGAQAQLTCPEIRQLLLARIDGMSDAQFGRACYIIRKKIERRVVEAGIEGFYIPSFSHRTIVYKGLLVAPQLARFYGDLQDEAFFTSIALYHQRYSTNTFPTWFLAQPFRFLGHNGEINTLQGNAHWMRARELAEDASLWGSKADMKLLRPIIQAGCSDSSALDNALESLVLCGRDLLHTVMMMMPEAYHAVPEMNEELRAFYEYHACLQEPWDGPAAVAFTDGHIAGAALDRNGLRPARYQVSDDGLFVLSSEVGVVDAEGARVLEKGRLGPGQIIALDTVTGELMKNDAIKERCARQAPYRDWVSTFLIDGTQRATQTHSAFSARQATVTPVGHTNGLAAAPGAQADCDIPLVARQKLFGYTTEDIEEILKPMARSGYEPLGSMGDDIPLAVLSAKPRLLYAFFRQRFAQVTNPPIDPLREKLVMSLHTLLGSGTNLWDEVPEACRRIRFDSPLLDEAQAAWLRSGEAGPRFKTCTIDTTFAMATGTHGLHAALKKVRSEAANAVKSGCSLVFLSDRGANATFAPIPALLAVGAVHHHLIRGGLRTRVSLIAETGEARDSHHYACLIGYGAAAILPYLAYDTVAACASTEGPNVAACQRNYRKACEAGLLKIMSKMGISTMSSYQGAQIFEALGLAADVVEECFTHTPTSIKGLGYPEIACDVLRHHESAFPSDAAQPLQLENFAFLRYRKGGEEHAFNPIWFKTMHDAVRNDDYDGAYRAFAEIVNNRPQPVALRDLIEYIPSAHPIPVGDVEPVEKIFPYFATGAMSHGSLSSQAHECLAIAMNRIGARSNSGEGGEDPGRFSRDANGDWRNSAIKQVASGRFGLTPEYAASAKELQIKMAQGAKPGEGGQLPGYKVSPEIAFIRHSVPGVTLISPPPHHDIYSIEDLAQLIHDLKQVNPRARVSVKLVAQAGVGTVAAGVAKAYADTIVISGHDGGTGASPIGSIKNTGVSWELGLAETQQVLVQNGLRGRVRLHADGGFKTGRDVIIAALLGAEEYGFGSAALVAAGCVMARQCHLNSCPVGVATQREDLREKFSGKPEHIVNFFHFIASEVREHMAKLGVRRLEQLIGRTELLRMRDSAIFPKTHNVDLAPLFFQFEQSDSSPRRCIVGKNDRGATEFSIDELILQDARDAIANGRELTLSYPIKNTNRTVGGRIAGEIAYKYGDRGLPQNTLTLKFTGTAGQSFGAFCIQGLRLDLTGEACDYVGKSMHGGTIVVRPDSRDSYVWHENSIIGNTVMYGATGGELFAAGRAGERFAVRNSGGVAVVEGVGDHACEYMTGGAIVVLGETGRNFGAGMSGGTAFVYDATGTLERRFNPDMVGLANVASEEDIATLRDLIDRHRIATGSPRAEELLVDWSAALLRFYKVTPHPENQSAAEAPVRAPLHAAQLAARVST